MGFANPALDSGIAFRVLLDSMARPGRINSLSSLGPLSGLSGSTWTLVNTLVDQAAPLYLDPVLRTAEIVDAVRFATGARVVAREAEAAFAITTPDNALAVLLNLPIGTPEYPDRSATLVIQCAGLSRSRSVALTGPGIRDLESLAAEGLESQFWMALAARNREHYPMGTDVFLTAPGTVACVARSTRIEVR